MTVVSPSAKPVGRHSPAIVGVITQLSGWAGSWSWSMGEPVGHYTRRQRVGLWLNLLAVLLTTAVTILWLPLVWGG